MEPTLNRIDEAFIAHSIQDKLIDYDALKEYNAELVEDGGAALTVDDAYSHIHDLYAFTVEELIAGAREAAQSHIERFIDRNYRCYQGNELNYLDNGEFILAVADTAKNNLY